MNGTLITVPKRVDLAIKTLKLVGRSSLLFDLTNIQQITNEMTTRGFGDAADWIRLNRDSYIQAVTAASYQVEQDPQPVQPVITSAPAIFEEFPVIAGDFDADPVKPPTPRRRYQKPVMSDPVPDASQASEDNS